MHRRLGAKFFKYQQLERGPINPFVLCETLNRRFKFVFVALEAPKDPRDAAHVTLRRDFKSWCFERVEYARDRSPVWTYFGGNISFGMLFGDTHMLALHFI